MPTLASTSRAQLQMIQETTYGVTPVAGNGRKLRMSGESLDYALTKTASPEIRLDRQVSGQVTTSAASSGGFNFSMQYAEYDPIIAGALQGSWSAYGTNGVGTTFSMTAAATTITAAVAPTGSSAFTGLQLGQWFKLNAPGGLNDGVFFKVSSSVAPTSTVITLDASTPAQVEAGIAGSSVATSRITNGTTQISFTLEKFFSDVTQYISYTGMTPDKMNLTIASAALTTGSFSFMGKSAARGTATVLPGTIAASQTYDIQNGVKGVGQLWEGGAPITTTFIKQITLDSANNLRGQQAVANLGNVGIGSGDFVPSGKISVYFADGALYDKFLGDVYTSLVVGTRDAAKNGYVFTLPRVQLSNGKIVAGAKNQDIMAEFDFTGFSDDTNAVAGLRQSLFIDRLGAAVVP